MTQVTKQQKSFLFQQEIETATELMNLGEGGVTQATPS